MFESGLRLASFGVGSALVMPLAGRLSDRWGSRNLALTGAAIALLSSFAFSRFDAQTDGFWPLLAAFTLGIGTGSAGAPVIGSVYRTLPGYLVPQGSSVLYTLNQLGASIGMSVVALLMLNAGDRSAVRLRRCWPGVSEAGPPSAVAAVPRRRRS